MKTGVGIEPYLSISNWNYNDKLTKENIPKWWIAYNSLKHDTKGIIEQATLENAYKSLSALFLLIVKIYGNGLITDYLEKPIYNEKEVVSELISIRSSRMFTGQTFRSVNEEYIQSKPLK